MTKDEMFELANEIYDNLRRGAFEALPDHLKFHKREDISGFLLLDKICTRIPDNNDSQRLISASEHNVVYLSVDPNEIAEVITEEEIHALIASGIIFSSHEDCLLRFT